MKIFVAVLAVSFCVLLGFLFLRSSLFHTEWRPFATGDMESGSVLVYSNAKSQEQCSSVHGYFNRNRSWNVVTTQCFVLPSDKVCADLGGRLQNGWCLKG